MRNTTPPGLPGFIGPLLAQMEEEMVLRGFTRDTRRLYLAHIRRFYSGGLRVGEAASLKVKDIDSERGQIHIRQGKRRTDRYVMLSPVVLEVLREYVRVDNPTTGSSRLRTGGIATSRLVPSGSR